MQPAWLHIIATSHNPEYRTASILRTANAAGWTPTIPYLQTYDFIGPVTAYHLAKNLGLDVAKEDRHLARMAGALGFQCGTDLCEAIADHLHETVRVVDVVLWRFATLEPEYCSILQERLLAYSRDEYGVRPEQQHPPDDHSCACAFTLAIGVA